MGDTKETGPLNQHDQSPYKLTAAETACEGHAQICTRSSIYILWLLAQGVYGIPECAKTYVCFLCITLGSFPLCLLVCFDIFCFIFYIIILYFYHLLEACFLMRDTKDQIQKGGKGGRNWKEQRKAKPHSGQIM